MANRQRPNIAAALGGWSTRHRKLAIFGWLGFVIVTMSLGSASGQAGLADYQQLAGGSAQAEKIIDQAGLKDPSAELVLVQSRRPVDPSPGPWERYPGYRPTSAATWPKASTTTPPCTALPWRPSCSSW